MWWQNILIPFRQPHYVVVALVSAWLVFSSAVWLSSLGLIGTVWDSDLFGLIDKIELLFNLYGAINTNFTLLSATITSIIAILFGIQVALLTYYIKHRQTGATLATIGLTSFGGLVSSLFGVGCAACGSLIAMSLLSLTGAGGLLLFLPLNGQEFGLLGVALLCYSIYTLAKKLPNANVC